jgi:anti-sigma factor RsiW
MRNINERPVCHRAEDLVTYLYGEANQAEARDFASHMQRCDACRAEFTVFNQVHDSIVAWRNEALGSVLVSEQIKSSVAQTVSDSTPFVQHERKLSALAALRQFFTVSPLWLRGAAAFAGLLLCALMVLAISRVWQRPVQVAKTGNGPIYSQEQLDQEVQKRVDEELAKQTKASDEKVQTPELVSTPKTTKDRNQLASNPVRSKNQRRNGLNSQEREQLAADLGLIPGREDETPFVFPDEPRQ